jgi:OOP family OmpA-OmpF porin
VRIEVRGHTDATGSAESNRVLSEKRALAVRDYLIAQGVSADRITARGFGEDFPIAPNDTREGRAKNRRVEIHRTN